MDKEDQERILALAEKLNSAPDGELFVIFSEYRTNHGNTTNIYFGQIPQRKAYIRCHGELEGKYRPWELVIPTDCYGDPPISRGKVQVQGELAIPGETITEARRDYEWQPLVFHFQQNDVKIFAGSEEVETLLKTNPQTDPGKPFLAVDTRLHFCHFVRELGIKPALLPPSLHKK